LVKLLCLGGEHPSIDARPPIRREHAPDLIQREPTRAPERDQREPLEDSGIEEASQTSPADRGDQALFLVKPQRRSGNARAPRHLGYVHLDLKST
jgi:hypothetical protein